MTGSAVRINRAILLLAGAAFLVHSGPECFAGATAEQVSRSGGD